MSEHASLGERGEDPNPGGRAPGGRLRHVLVLSHLFPHPSQPHLGPFVLEQVQALREYQRIDARVISGRPFWINTVRPDRFLRALLTYLRGLRERHRLEWRSHDGVPVLYVPYLAGGFFQFPSHALSYSRAAVYAAHRIRHSFPFQLVHAHTSYPDGPGGLALAQRFGVPLVLTEHTGPFSRLMDNRLVRPQALRALTGATKVLCVSTSLAGEVRAQLPGEVHGRVHTLANGVNTEAFRLPARWTPDPEAPRLVSVTGFEPVKNPLLLLRAFRRLLGQIPGASLTVVGGGPLEAEVRAYIEAHGLGERVTLLGRLGRVEVAWLLREACDVFVLSSDSETFGVVLVEALASGKPVVATDCGGPADIVVAPWLGRLCAPRSEEALAATLAAVIRDLPTFDPARIRAHAVGRFDYRQVTRSLAAAYEAAYRQLYPPQQTEWWAA